MKRYVGELISIEEVPEATVTEDEDGLEWKDFIRRIKLVGYREKNNDIVRELPEELDGKIIDQPRKLCISEGYEWHFKTKIIDRPVLLTFNEEDSKRIEKGDYP
jgi:hypothetical protein